VTRGTETLDEVVNRGERRWTPGWERTGNSGLANKYNIQVASFASFAHRDTEVPRGRPETPSLEVIRDIEWRWRAAPDPFGATNTRPITRSSVACGHFPQLFLPAFSQRQVAAAVTGEPSSELRCGSKRGMVQCAQRSSIRCGGPYSAARRGRHGLALTRVPATDAHNGAGARQTFYLLSTPLNTRR
jgi:hypothetical protein